MQDRITAAAAEEISRCGDLPSESAESAEFGKPTRPLTGLTPLTIVLMEAFESLPDPRVKRTRLHRLSDILMLSLAAFCCGAEGFEDIQDWAEDRGVDSLRETFGVRLDNGIPHHDTFGRVLKRLNPHVLEANLHRIRRALLPEPEHATPDHIAVDGKELRGSHDASEGKDAMMLLSAYATDWNLVLGQKKVDAKTNEIPTAVEVLSQIAIEGATVTADALHCQKETAKVIRERRAHYLLAVKENQHALYQALIGLFETNRTNPCLSNRLSMERHRTLEKDHGRIEERRGFVIRAADWLPEGDPLWEQWKDLTSVMCLETKRTWTHRGQRKTSVYTRYFISSSVESAERLMGYARSHWKIENNLHWVMDVTFGEDASRARKGFEAENLATLRRTAAFLLKQSIPKNGRKGAEQVSLRRRKKIAGWNPAYLLQTLTI